MIQPMATNFYPLKVTEKVFPIKDATTITFALPKALEDTFHFLPGQHLVLQLLIDGQQVRRSYSLCNCPLEKDKLQITVKRVQGGLVSNYIVDQIEAGDVIHVMPPQGRFKAEVQSEEYKTYYLFSAGSGITPIYSILQMVLQQAPNSQVHLFYGNKDQDTIIFKKELEEWQVRYPNRLSVVHTLSMPKTWTSWTPWKGRKGRIDAAAIEWFINTYSPVAQQTEYFICGPGAMNRSIKKSLLELGIPKTMIHIEQFGGAVKADRNAVKVFPNAQLSASINGQFIQLHIPEGKTILQTLKEAKAKPPYSCESGVCGTCVAQVVSGEVEMNNCMALSEEEVGKGEILTCQAVPISEKVGIKF
ncbi:MAG: ferredoxin--NADP reductase [Bacteroidota bacterium]